jgi:hypothetical protein
MSFIDHKALALAILVLGMIGLVVPAGAARQCASAECACEKALEKNTAEALEEFLTKYQHDASVKETACGALGILPDNAGGDDENAEIQSSADQADCISLSGGIKTMSYGYAGRFIKPCGSAVVRRGFGKPRLRADG